MLDDRSAAGTLRCWKLELRGRRLLHPNGTFVPNEQGEFALLLAFLKALRRRFTGGHLLQATRLHEDIFDRSIDVQILRRSKKKRSDREGMFRLSRAQFDDRWCAAPTARY